MKYTSQVLASASGSAGGLTYSRNRFGKYTRARSVPVNPNTSRQQTVRGFFALLAARWKDVLTAAQRLAWTNHSNTVTRTDALGQSYNPGAQGYYIGVNTLRKQMGLDLVDPGPVTPGIADLTPVTCSATASSVTLSLAFTNTDSWAVTSGGALGVFVSPPQAASVNFYAGPYQYAGKISGAGTPPTSPQNVTMPQAAGPSGSKLFVQVRAVDAEGRMSEPFRTSDTV